MRSESIERELKKELNRINIKLKQARFQRLVASVTSGIVIGVVLSTVPHHLPLLIAMAAGGAVLNAIAKRLVFRKKSTAGLKPQQR